MSKIETNLNDDPRAHDDNDNDNDDDDDAKRFGFCSNSENKSGN